RARALNPLAAADGALLAVVGRGEFTLNGLRNRDVRQALFGATAAAGAERRRQSAAVTRQLRLLRAHGIVQKVPKTHRYQVTSEGRALITAVLAASQADVNRLAEAA